MTDAVKSPLTLAIEEAERKGEQEARKHDIENGLRVVDRILKCSDDEFASRQFILAQVMEFGIRRNPWKHMAGWTRQQNTSTFGLLQIPTEFADFLWYISRLDIRSAVEIGVMSGASSYIMCAVLQRAKPDVDFVMVDIQDNLIGFDGFAERLNIRKLIPATSYACLDETYDFVFIDADHSYMGAKKDWLNVGRRAQKAVAFHDIHGHEYNEQGGGIVRAWNEIKTALAEDHTVLEFAHSTPRWMGIGLAVRAS